ncbi:MAG: glycosyltransferase [Elusimicrobia bacterium]|nr:glycosyltransferase [Elusimicrobiota bacterium]
MNKNILAVIVSYNPNDSIIKLYQSIKNQVDELIIVDNFSTNKESKQILETLSKEATIIYNDKNLGIATALNQGAKYAIANGYKWLLTLDQDSEFLPGTYEKLLSSYETLPDKDKTMLIAPMYKEKNRQINNIADNNLVIWKEDCFVITSGSLIKTESFNHIGFFEEKLFIDRVDFDFCLRLKKDGFSSKIATNIFFIHNLGNWTNKTHSYNYSAKRRYYMARNAVYLFKKYFFLSPIQILINLKNSGIFLSVLKVLLYEDDKFRKISQSYKGFLDGFFL